MANKPDDILDLLRLSYSEIALYLKATDTTDMAFTDFTARLTTLTADITEQCKAAKDAIKARLLAEDKTISEGHHIIATLTKSEVSRLDMDRVKQFLGARLPNYQVTSSEYRLTFKAKG